MRIRGRCYFDMFLHFFLMQFDDELEAFMNSPAPVIVDDEEPVTHLTTEAGRLGTVGRVAGATMLASVASMDDDDDDTEEIERKSRSLAVGEDSVREEQFVRESEAAGQGDKEGGRSDVAEDDSGAAGGEYDSDEPFDRRVCCSTFCLFLSLT